MTPTEEEVREDIAALRRQAQALWSNAEMCLEGRCADRLEAYLALLERVGVMEGALELIADPDRVHELGSDAPEIARAALTPPLVRRWIVDNGASLSATGLSSASPIEPPSGVSPVPASIPCAVTLWREAVRAGKDYPCKYWGIAACAYHYGHNCSPCRSLEEYIAIATEARRAETPLGGSVHEGAGLKEASPTPSPETDNAG